MWPFNTLVLAYSDSKGNKLELWKRGSQYTYARYVLGVPGEGYALVEKRLFNCKHEAEVHFDIEASKYEQR